MDNNVEMLYATIFLKSYQNFHEAILHVAPTILTFKSLTPDKRT